jgi:anti-sigma regulatory factor (Ser/Thr protein kinase)
MIAERDFPNVPAAVTEARRYALATLGPVAPEIAEDVAVMVSELATNCLRHASSRFTVRIDRAADHIRIDVDDVGPGTPEVQAPQPSQPSGRGLQIVQALSQSWGVRQHTPGPGKTVWFVVAANYG